MHCALYTSIACIHAITDAGNPTGGMAQILYCWLHSRLSMHQLTYGADSLLARQPEAGTWCIASRGSYY